MQNLKNTQENVSCLMKNVISIVKEHLQKMAHYVLSVVNVCGVTSKQQLDQKIYKRVYIIID